VTAESICRSPPIWTERGSLCGGHSDWFRRRRCRVAASLGTGAAIGAVNAISVVSLRILGRCWRPSL